MHTSRFGSLLLQNRAKFFQRHTVMRIAKFLFKQTWSTGIQKILYFAHHREKFTGIKTGQHRRQLPLINFQSKIFCNGCCLQRHGNGERVEVYQMDFLIGA